jgi:hypothetical protein
MKFPKLDPDGETHTAVSTWVEANPDGECAGDARDELEELCKKELPDRTPKQVKKLIGTLIRKLRNKMGIGVIRPQYTNDAHDKRKHGELNSESNDNKANSSVRHPKNKQRPL